MLAKVIAWAPTRDEAARILARGLHGMRLHGPTTNRDLLVNVLRHKAFLAGDTDTAFFDRHGLDVLAAPLVDAEGEALSALAAALAADAAALADRPVLRGVPSGWRNVVSQLLHADFDGPAGRHAVRYRLSRDGLVTDPPRDVELIEATPGTVVVEVAGVRRAFAVARHGADVYVDSAYGAVRFAAVPRFDDPADHVAPGSLLAPMPGSVARIAATIGDQVTAGQPILWLEAMKMQHQINAPADGVLAELPVTTGQQVDVGTVLAVVTGNE
jgi:propionyl-CoA carboxylase alpha chain